MEKQCCGQEGQFILQTSGTTSGEKHIPISKESMPYHIKGSIDATMHYINETSKTGFLNKKLFFCKEALSWKKIRLNRAFWNSCALHFFFKNNNAILGSELY